MLIKQGSKFQLYPHWVKYSVGDEFKEGYALPSKQWWEQTAKKHDHIDIITFEEIEVTEAMQKRYESVRNMPDDFTSVYIDYVKDGTLPDKFPSNHPFKQIIVERENEQQAQDLTDAELESMSQGQELTDMNIRLMALEGK